MLPSDSTHPPRSALLLPLDPESLQGERGDGQGGEELQWLPSLGGGGRAGGVSPLSPSSSSRQRSERREQRGEGGPLPFVSMRRSLSLNDYSSEEDVEERGLLGERRHGRLKEMDFTIYLFLSISALLWVVTRMVADLFSFPDRVERSNDHWRHSFVVFMVGLVAVFHSADLKKRLHTSAPSQLRALFVVLYLSTPPLYSLIQLVDKTSLSPASLRKASYFGIFMLFLGLCLAMGLVGYHVNRIQKLQGRKAAFFHFLPLFLGASLLGLLSLWDSAYRRFHLHHYLWCSGLACVFTLESPISASSQAILLAAGLQGAAVWGIDPLWNPKDARG